MKRENFKSRLGFILISAGCAIGIGNVWKFPYVTGQNGGGFFVLFYLFFLLIVGVPIFQQLLPCLKILLPAAWINGILAEGRLQ